MVLVPADVQLDATEDIVGTDGVDNMAALLNDAEAADVHPETVVVTVYEVPTTIPEIKPVAPTVGPVGVNVYVFDAL